MSAEYIGEDLKVNCISAAIGLLIQHGIITQQELDKLTKTNYQVFYDFLMEKLVECEFGRDKPWLKMNQYKREG